jgi:hypothetical protein
VPLLLDPGSGMDKKATLLKSEVQVFLSAHGALRVFCFFLAFTYGRCVKVVMAVNEMRGEEAVEVGREELQCGLILRYSIPSRDIRVRPLCSVANSQALLVTVRYQGK